MVNNIEARSVNANSYNLFNNKRANRPFTMLYIKKYNKTH